MRKISKEDREIQVKTRAKELGHEFIGWLDGHENKDSKLIIKCHKHGNWTPTISNYTRNGRCMKCVIESRRMSVKDTEKRIKKYLKHGQEILGAIGEYKNNNTKFKINCTKHGEWSASALHLIHSKSGCPKCGYELVREKRRHSLIQLKTMICEILSTEGKYLLTGMDGEYINSKSRVILSCKDHGEWSVDISTVLSGKSGCHSCAKAGFKPNLEASLYFLRSLCGDYFKVGISNRTDRRMIELKRSTPFEFVELDRINGKGCKIKEMEKALHSEFESAKMKGFNGSTEWFIWSDLITDRIKQLKHP